MRSGMLTLGLLFVSASCTKETTLPTDQTNTGSNPAGTTSSTRSTSVASCPEYPDSPELARACMFDSNGKTYAEDGTVYVLPAAPPYGAIFAFQPSYFPLPEDAISVGPTAGIRAYAAPYDVQSGTQCCSEDSEANRIPAETVLDDNGVLTISVTNAEPQGDQIAIILDYGGLYRHRLTPDNGGACDLPSQEACANAPTSGFAMRFYVRAAAQPSQVTPSQTTAPSVPPVGTCLLEYNSALAAGDPCCYYKSGANTCDASVRCNERSGAGCCLLYGTDNTRYGERCCLYANGGKVDGADECAQLLATK